MRRIGTPLALLVVTGLAACGGDRPAAGGETGGEVPAAGGTLEGWYTRADGLDYGGDELQVLREAQGFGFRTTHGGVAFQERDVRHQFPLRVEAAFLQRQARPDDRGAYGIFVGGRHVLAAGQEYIAFVLRPSGQYRIERRVGGEITPVVDWTPAGVIRGAGEEGEVPMNLLRVEAGGGTVEFFINNELVATFPVTLVDPLGAVGIRVDEGLNLTVMAWEVG